MWPARIQRWEAQIRNAASATGALPDVLAAICDRESLGGDALTPPGPTGTGDGGHGRGLFQIDDRAYPDFTADIAVWGDPAQNALKGAQILMANMKALGGNLPGAVAAYNAGLAKVLRIKHMNPSYGIEDVDPLTTGGNYVSDVLLIRLPQFQAPEVTLEG